MTDDFLNVLLRELQRFTEAHMRQAVALEQLAESMERIAQIKHARHMEKKK